jgi:hypothetical protein
MQAGFNGDAAVGGQSILSTADLFRSAAPAAVVRFWQNRYLLLSRGTALPVPAGAPGTSRLLLRGHLQSEEVLLYLWQHGRAVLSAWLIGKPGTLRIEALTRLAREQDRRVSVALRVG